MKNRIVTTLCMGVMGLATAMAAVHINGTEYAIDTIIHRQIGPGITHTVARIPDYPLNVYILSTDLTNPHNRVETTLSYNTVGRTELLTNAYTRLRTDTKRPVAACNANFWVVGGSGAPWNVYALGTPMGAIVRNDTTYVNTNTTADQWNGGPSRTGATAITHDKTVYNGRFYWVGTVKCDKLGGELQLANVNRRNLSNDLALWNEAYTRTRAFETNWIAFNERGENLADNYYLRFAPGETWRVSKDMKFIVASVVNGADRQTLGDYDACITATGSMKQAMASLATGDEITVFSGWRVNDPDRVPVFIDVENMVEGNAYIMHNGELTNRNENETYNSQVYSRTCYGSSADGKHLYMLVIDKATSKLYGSSAGCPTSVACQILKSMCPDVTEIVNYDAGGSAEMMVHGNIINTTTEGIPRAVASGWMLEAVGEEDNTVASIAFADYRLKMPVYSSHVPQIWGYNARGELVDTDVKGFSLSCDETLGHTDSDTFTAGGNAIDGTLTATVGGMTATLPVRLLPAQPAIKQKPFIVIDEREYPIEVTATVDNTTYTYDHTQLGWTVGDPSIATVEQGVLKGISNGTTTVTCQIGEFTDAAEVHVEISPTPYILQSLEQWNCDGSGAKNIAMDPQSGVISFSMGSSRTPYLNMEKDVTFFGLPDSIGITFSCSLQVPSIQFDVRNAEHNSMNYQTVDIDNNQDTGNPHTAYVDIDALGGADKVTTYPIELKDIQFNLKKGANKDNTLTVHRIFAHYPVNKPAVPGDVNGDGEASIADVTLLVDLILNNADNGRSDVNGDGETGIADITTLIQMLLQ